MIIPPGYANVRLRWAQTGDPDEYISTFGVRLQAGVSDPVVVAAGAAAIWLANFPLAGLADEYTFVGATAQIGNDGGEYPTGESLLNDAGTWNAAPAPSNCALLMRKASALGGRRNRGRMYVPAGYLSEVTVDSLGRIDTGVVAAYQAQAKGFLSDIEADIAFDAMVILHSSAPLTPTLVTSLAVDGTIATQRRRMRR